MVYTVEFDLDIDDENIANEEELKDVVEEVFKSINSSISNFKLIEVND